MNMSLISYREGGCSEKERGIAHKQILGTVSRQLSSLLLVAAMAIEFYMWLLACLTMLY